MTGLFPSFMIGVENIPLEPGPNIMEAPQPSSPSSLEPPDAMAIPWDWKRMAPTLFGLGLFGFLLIALNPSFFLDDSPETVTAAWLLGIPHPPGYPLHTLLGRLATLLPLGQPCFRVNLLSALLAVLVSILLSRLLARRFGLGKGFAFLFGFLWILGTTSYPAALGAKGGVYQLTSLLLLLIVSSLLSGRLLLAAFFWGVSLSNHWMSMAVLTPGFLVLAFASEKREELNYRFLWQALSVALMGISVHLALPFRALADPAVNWGEPKTLGNLLFNLSRAQYRGAEATGGIRDWLVQGWYFLKTSILEWPGLWFLAAAGFWTLRKERRAAIWGLAALWLGMGFSLSVYLHLTDDRLYLIDAYSMPVHLVTLLLAGAWLSKVLADRARPERSRAFLAFLLVLSLVLAGDRYRTLRQTDYTYDFDYTQNAMRAAPRGALLYCRGDGLVFPGWYLQYVLHQRLDLAMVGVDGLPMEWVRRHLMREHPGLKVPMPTWKLGLESIPQLERAIAVNNPDRPLYLSYNKVTDASFPDAQVFPYGVDSEALIPPAVGRFDSDRADGLWATLRLRNFDAGPIDSRTRANLLKDYAINRNSLGVYWEEQADRMKAGIPGQKPAEGEDFDRVYGKCLANYQWAEAFFPTDYEFSFNIGNAYYNLNRKPEAINWYRRCTDLKPDFTDGYYNWAVAAFQSTDFYEAARLFNKVLELDPKRQGALEGMKYLKAIKVVPDAPEGTPTP